jgi:ribonuclease HII
MAACVFIPEKFRELSFWRDVRDSKKLTPKKRDGLIGQIKQYSFFGIAEATRGEIDELNIHHATLLAMKRAFETMNLNFKLTARAALIDGKFAPKLSCECKTVIGGDDLSLSIAAASILAKVTRDRLMAALHNDFPHYGWATNAGYSTAQHLEAIRLHGVCAHHRRSFAPVTEKLAEPAARKTKEAAR